ncbi:hypothetical protein SAMN05216215_108124 [Saccharopolyspora shandongensis]|uniref:Nitroreductase family protein n=1 Tax=Saccharopolyspora shandongensis TaxID=418495 RepID=A0A1H3TEH9_9PSEU|nr:hypothetical protein [Saccharopolyspora shandongensis]SDZ48672.1 hypothetical protein SAMN05216215_108124 [Saccharopolyspora shandongensis]
MYEGVDRDVLEAAVALATRAPSLFNVQPWQWQAGANSLHLLLDRSRGLTVTDPAFRELTISCGAALHHAVVALHALGRQVRVHLWPDPAAPDRLAAIDVVGSADPSQAELALAGAAGRRRTDRRQYAPDAVPGRILDDLVLAGEEVGAKVMVAEGDDRYALARAFAKAAALHGAREDYRAELAAWTGLSEGMAAGVSAAAAPRPGAQYGDIVLRDFGRVAIAHEETGSAQNAGCILMVSTSADDTVAHLIAGEAISAVLCTAELEGLAGSPLSEAFEIEQTRNAIRHEVLADAGYPQLALRIGWPTTARGPSPTGRRQVHELLHDLLDDHAD